MNAVPVAFPSVRTVPIPAVITATSREVAWNGVSALVVTSSFDVDGGVTGGGIARGTGGKTFPSWTISDPRTTSSSRSMLYLPFPPMESKNLVMLLE
jgi:hypothetical protein